MSEFCLPEHVAYLTSPCLSLLIGKMGVIIVRSTPTGVLRIKGINRSKSLRTILITEKSLYEYLFLLSVKCEDFTR